MLRNGPDFAKKQYELYGLPNPLPPETRQTSLGKRVQDDMVEVFDGPSETQARPTTQAQMSEKKIYKEIEGTIEMSADKLTEFIEARSSGANSEEYQQYHVTQDNALKTKVDDYQN